MRTILVAVDGSEVAARALALAVEMAKPMDAGIRLIHVINWWAPAVPTGITEQLEAGARDFGQMLLDDARKSLESAGVATETMIRAGIPAEEIAQESESPDVWMVVMGGHGKGTVQRLILGSASNRLLQIVKKPVLIVR